MHYLTRHLEAQTEISHGDKLLRKGDRFYATPVDADYYLRHKKVVEVKAEASVVAPTPTPTDEQQRRRGRPTNAEVAARAGSAAAKPVPPATALPGVDSLVMTSRDLPGPAQNAPPADVTKPRTDA